MCAALYLELLVAAIFGGKKAGMAQLPGGATEGRETYRYAASSYRAKSNEEELFEMVQLSGIPLDKELFKVVLELLKLNVAPTAILQIIKTMRSQATQSSLPPSLHSSRAHSPDGSTSQHSKIEPPSQPIAQRDFSQHHVSGSDRVAPPQTSVDKSTGGQGLRATKTKSSEKVRSGVKPISGERHMKSQSSKQGRKRKSQESTQTK